MSDKPQTAAQELARFLGLPSRIEVGNTWLGLQDFHAWTEGCKLVHIEARFVRFAPRGDATEQIKRYELREVNA